MMDDVTQPSLSSPEPEPTDAVKRNMFSDDPADTEQGASQLELTQISKPPTPAVPIQHRAEPTYEAVPTVIQEIPPVPGWSTPVNSSPTMQMPRTPLPQPKSHRGRNLAIVLIGLTLV